MNFQLCTIFRHSVFGQIPHACYSDVNSEMIYVFRCEQALMSLVTVRNCIRYYQTAEEIRALALKEHCSELISNHWVRLNCVSVTVFVSGNLRSSASKDTN